MELEVAFHTDEGSPAAQFALATLANLFNINENALKTILNGAFDLLHAANGNSMLALQLSFSRLSYHVDNTTLFGIMREFRHAFGPALSVEGGKRFFFLKLLRIKADNVSVEHMINPPAVYSQSRGAVPTLVPPDHSVYMSSSHYPASGLRSSYYPLGQYASSPVVCHWQTQVYPPPWNTGYTGNNPSSAPQPVVMSANQRQPTSQGHQGGHERYGHQGGVPSFFPIGSSFGQYQ
jgi:hypothetical protein